MSAAHVTTTAYWMHLPQNLEQQVHERWLLRHATQSIASVSLDSSGDWWITMLQPDGGCRVLPMRAATLVEAKIEAQCALRALGWNI